MTTNTDTNSTSRTRQITINSLAVVGFLALVALGVWLAIYSTRFVPSVVNRIGVAAVYLGSVFNSGSDQGPTLSVVPTPTNTATTTSTTTTSTTHTSPGTKPVVNNVGGTKTNGTSQTGSTIVRAPYGLSDLQVTINEVGYLTTTSPDSFVASSSVPHNGRPAVKFTITNNGTNWTGTWRFSIDIPLSRTPAAAGFEKCEQVGPGIQRCTSYPQPSLNPGGYLDGPFAFDQARAGSDQKLTITADLDNTVPESNEGNNSVSTSLNVLD